MKKLLSILMCLAMVFALVGCTKEEEVEKAYSKYDVCNITGDSVTELYLYEVGSSDKGTNYGPLDKNGTVTISTEADADKTDGIVYVLEFKTEKGDTQKFENLHFEEAPIYLLSADEAAGATQISFSEPERKAIYNIVNTTGKKVTSLYIYEDAANKGENYAGEAGLANEESVEVTFTELATKTGNHVYILEFQAEGDEPQFFNTLHFEVATINLLSVDAAAGATQVSWGY